MKRVYHRAVPILSNALLLFLAIYGVAFCLITGFSLPADYAVLGRDCILISLFFTGLYALPKLWHRAAALGLSLLALGWWTWERLNELLLGALAAVRQVVRLYVTAFGLSGSMDLTEYLGELTLAEETRLVTAFLFLFFALLGCILGWLVCRAGSFWGSLCCTAPFLLAVLANTTTPDWLPLTMLLLFWGLGLLGRHTDRVDPGGTAKLTLWAAPAVLVLLLGLRLLLPEGDFQRQDWTERLRLLSTDWLTLAGQNIVNAPGTSSVFGARADGAVDLSQAGPLDFNGRTALRVESDTTGRIYLRGFSSAVYDGGWGPLEDEAYEVLEGPPSVESLDMDRLISSQSSNSQSFYSQTIRLPTSDGGEIIMTATGGIGEFNPMNFPALADDSGPAVRVVVENAGAPSGYVYTPYQLATTPGRMTGAEFVQDAYLARGAGVWRHILYARDSASPQHGKTLTGDAAAAELAYRDFVYENYLQVPDAVHGKIWDFLEEDGRLYNYAADCSPGGVAAMAGVMGDILEDWAVYDPETSLTPEGEDFVGYFLTESRTGYCMHFASAATLMLRSIGIPARYTSGYVADVKAGERTAVPDYNAHAWVEVYCDGYGWQPVEVTPGFEGDYPWERRTDTEAPTPTPPPSATPKPTPEPTPPRTSSPPTPPKAAEQVDMTVLWWLLVPAVLLLLGLAFVLRRTLAARERERLFTQEDTNRALIALYTYGHHVLDFLGSEETDALVETLGHKAAFSSHIMTEEERAAVRHWAEELARETDSTRKWLSRLRFRYWRGLY